MSGFTVRVLVVLAAAALLLAFASSLALVSSQNAASVSGKPLIQYGTR